jgi:hypothetical protein
MRVIKFSARYNAVTRNGTADMQHHRLSDFFAAYFMFTFYFLLFTNGLVNHLRRGKYTELSINAHTL